MMNQAPKQKTKKDVRDIRAEALKIARSIQVEGQASVDTKAITTGIQRGMEMFLRKQSEISCDLDKRIKKVKQQALANTVVPVVDVPIAKKSSGSLPWVLLAVSWVLFIAVGVWLLVF